MSRKDYAAEKGNGLTFTITAWQQQVGLNDSKFELNVLSEMLFGNVTVYHRASGCKVG